MHCLIKTVCAISNILLSDLVSSQVTVPASKIGCENAAPKSSRAKTPLHQPLRSDISFPLWVRW